MPSLELNKIAAAVLVTGISVMMINVLGDTLVAPKMLAKNAYVVDVAAPPAAVASAAPAAAGGKPAAGAPAPAAGPAPIAPLLAAATADAGEKLTKQCTACHTFAKGGPNRVGPNLWDVVGRNRGSADGFAYSATLAGMKGEAWDYEAINQFLANPKGFVAGTKMAFAGLKKPEERANVIAYLRSLSDAPKPLP